VGSVGQEIFAVRVEHGDAVLRPVEGSGVMPAGHDSGNRLEIKPDHEGGDFARRGFAAVNHRLAGDQAGRFDIGDYTLQPEIVTEGFVEEEQPLQVFTGRDLADVGTASHRWERLAIR